MQILYKFRVIPLAWWLIWMTLHAFYLVQTGWSREIALTDSLISNILLAGLCSGVLFSVQYNRPEPKRMAILLGGILLSSLFWVWLSNQILIEIKGSEPGYNVFLENSEMIRFLIGFFMISSFAMIGWITYFIKEQLEEKNRAHEVLRLSREAELIHLRQQLQPHFLFNTLNSVNALIGSNPSGAKKMILQLADFLRGTLKKEDHQPVPLEEELNYLNLYLEIEKVRFGNRLNTTIHADAAVSKLLIPVYLLQPLVENAIKFGLYGTIDEVNITIDAKYENQFLIVSISNPYDPDSTSAVHGTGFGLNAVSRRLFLLFNRNDLFEVISGDHKFTVTIKIPQLHA